MFLHEEHARALRVHGDVVYAVADLGMRVRDILRPKSRVDRLPGLAAIVGAESARRRDRDVNSLRIARIENDGVQTHAARTRLPLGSSAVTAQAGEFLPVLSAVGGAEDSSVFHSGINRVGIAERWLQVPHPLELPRMLRTVVPLMRCQRLAGFGGCIVNELVALALWRSRGDRFTGGRSGLVPGFAAVIGALNQLSEPSAALPGVNPIKIPRPSLDVVKLPARKMRAADIPLFALAIRSQNERALACTHHNSYLTHAALLFHSPFLSNSPLHPPLHPTTSILT